MAGKVLEKVTEFSTDMYIVSVELKNKKTGETDIFVLSREVEGCEMPKIMAFLDAGDFRKFLKEISKTACSNLDLFNNLVYKGNPRLHPIWTFDMSVFKNSGPVDVLSFCFDNTNLAYIKCDGLTAGIWRMGGEPIELPKIELPKMELPTYYVDPKLDEKVAAGDIFMGRHNKRPQ